MALTRVSPALFQVSNNITSVTVGGSANTISLTFDSNGVITGASNNAVSVANTAITGNIISSQITSVANTQLTGLIQAAQIGSANATLVTSGTLPGARLPAGSVLQVVQGNTSTLASTTNNSTFIDTNLTASITPSSASSKVLIMVSHGSVRIGSGSNGMNFRILRNATVLPYTVQEIAYQTSSMDMSLSFSLLDSPSLTSSITYKTQFKLLTASAATGQVNANSTDATIILMEIAG